ncbi:MAG: hypothetical protein O7G13_11410 [Alphaproteobacteria bacterium]|nr:hypothetical protein [Alphaproteobacteria bacterium]
MATKQTTGRAPAEPDLWRQPDGEVMNCDDSVKVLRENLGEIHELCQEALEDAVLMDVAEEQFREVLHDLIKGLSNPYKKG